MSEPKVIRKNSAEPVLSAYLHAKGIAQGIAVSGSFELTSRCNFNCKMCYVHSAENQKALIEKELTADQWLGIASDARNAGMLFLLLTGGEPFLREDFTKIYEELIKMGIMFSINTNSYLYNEEIRDTFRKYPPARINVSLYGGSEETYRSLCGNASYEKVIRNLNSMKDDHLPVRLNVTLTPYNIQDMTEIDRISKDIGLHVKATTYMYPPIRINGSVGNNPARFDAEEAGKLMAVWDCLRETDEQFKIRKEKMCTAQMREDADFGSTVKREGVTCRAGRSSFWITWDGEMLPCGMMSGAPVNVLEKGFVDAWERIRKLTGEILLPPECAVCNMRNRCSICAAISQAETGSFETKPEYICRLTKARCEETIRLADERGL